MGKKNDIYTASNNLSAVGVVMGSLVVVSLWDTHAEADKYSKDLKGMHTIVSAKGRPFIEFMDYLIQDEQFDTITITKGV